MSSTSASIPPTAPWLAHLRREAERFAEVVAQSPLRVHVPAYPDFTVHSLAAHIGRTLRLFRGIITTGSGEYQLVEAPDGEDVADWVLAAVDPLVTLLSEVPPDQPVPFPHRAGDRPAGLIAPLLAVTSHLGFGITVSSSTYEQPYALARKFGTLDHLSKGRVGWNIVTSYLDSAARNLGLD